jgi:hypothetical protein
MAYCISSRTRFTAGQKERVWATLRSIYRWSLVSSPGLIPVTTTKEAVLIASASSFDSICGYASSKLVVKNLGNTSISSMKAILTRNSVTDTLIATGLSIAPGATANVVFNAIPATPGTYSDYYEIIAVNGTADYLHTNNRLCTTTTFVLKRFSITTTGQHVTVIGTGSNYPCGSTATLTITPQTGYDLVAVLNGTDTVRSYVFTMDQNYQLSIITKLHTYIVTTAVYPANSGLITRSGSTTYMSVLTLTAHADSGFSFLHWKKNGVIVSTDTIYPYTAMADAQIDAYFKVVVTSITTHATPILGIYPNPVSDFLHVPLDNISRNNIMMITDIVGREIYRQESVGVREMIDVSSWPIGEYIITVADDGSIRYAKFIKK